MRNHSVRMRCGTASTGEDTDGAFDGGQLTAFGSRVVGLDALDKACSAARWAVCMVVILRGDWDGKPGRDGLRQALGDVVVLLAQLGQALHDEALAGDA